MQPCCHKVNVWLIFRWDFWAGNPKPYSTTVLYDRQYQNHLICTIGPKNIGFLKPGYIMIGSIVVLLYLWLSEKGQFEVIINPVLGLRSPLADVLFVNPLKNPTAISSNFWHW